MGPQIVIFSITIENVDNAKPEVLEVPLARWRLNQGQGSLYRSLPKSWASLNLLSVALSCFFDEYEIHSEPLSPSACVGFSLALQPQHLVRWKGRYYYYRLSTACLVKSAPQTDTERGEPRPTEDFSPNGDLGGGAKSIFDIKLDAGSVFCL